MIWLTYAAYHRTTLQNPKKSLSPIWWNHCFCLKIFKHWWLGVEKPPAIPPGTTRIHLPKPARKCRKSRHFLAPIVRPAARHRTFSCDQWGDSQRWNVLRINQSIGMGKGRCQGLVNAPFKANNHEVEVDCCFFVVIARVNLKRTCLGVGFRRIRKTINNTSPTKEWLCSAREIGEQGRVRFQWLDPFSHNFPVPFPHFKWILEWEWYGNSTEMRAVPLFRRPWNFPWYMPNIIIRWRENHVVHHPQENSRFPVLWTFQL